jgi:hypothetical protein
MGMTALCWLSFAAPTASAAPPTISRTTVAGVTTTSATLAADINPQGKAGFYRFEYGPDDCSSNPCTSTAKGKYLTGTIPVQVSTEVEGLSPGTTYHLRTILENSAKETTEGPDRVFATRFPAQVFAPCANDAFRKGASAHLPDCRAYEQASPVNKNGGDVTNTRDFIAASESGDGVAFLSDAGIPGGEGSQELPLYLASRGKGGWSTEGLLPPGSVGEKAGVIGWLPDFSQVFDTAGRFGDPQTAAFFARSSGGSLSTIFPHTPNPNFFSQFFSGASRDGSTVLFETKFALPGTGATEGKPNLYAWDSQSGEVSLAGVMSDGTPPAQGAFAGSYDWIRDTTPDSLKEGGAARSYYTQDQHAVSDDGSAAFFTAAGTGQLYMRLNPTAEQSALNGEDECTEPAKACTVRVSASQRTKPDPAGARPAAFMGATPDGSQVVFTSSEMLTDDANTGPEQSPPIPPAIGMAEIDGTKANPNLIPGKSASSMAVDGSHLYWMDTDLEAITRANLEGGEIEEEFIPAPGATGIAVDDKYIYWASPGANTIGRATIDGKEVKQDFMKVSRGPTGVAVDDKYIYWTTREVPTNGVLGGSVVSRADLDGSDIKEPFVIGCSCDNPRSVAVTETHIYYTSEFEGEWYIRGKFIDGSHDFALGNGLLFPSNGQPVTVIAADSHLYWVDPLDGTVGRSNLKFGEVEESFISGLPGAQGLAVDSSHIYWSTRPISNPNPGNDLYRYDTETGKLTDLSADADDVNGAEARGVLGLSDDGSRVYFVANGDLDGKGPAVQGNCPASFPTPGITPATCNLYLWEKGDIRFVTKLQVGGVDIQNDAANWYPSPLLPGLPGSYLRTSRVTADGRYLLFRSQRKLTDYDNEGIGHFYRYDAQGESILCVTCNRTGEAPATYIEPNESTTPGFPSLGWIAPATLIPSSPAPVLPPVLSGDGNRFFFETTDALAGADVNGEEGCFRKGGYNNKFPTCLDVYEWEAEGTGSCETKGGCHYLLSTGKKNEASLFGGVSTSGDDVFIFTREGLVGQDTDVQRDVYDVRVGGGLASQYPKAKPSCEGEGCKPATSAPPASQSAGTAAFSGPANPKPKRKLKKHRHKRKQHKRAHRRAKAERRAQR